MPALHNLVKRLSLTFNMKGPIFIKVQIIYLCDVVVSKLKFENFRGNRVSSFKIIPSYISCDSFFLESFHNNSQLFIHTLHG